MKKLLCVLCVASSCACLESGCAVAPNPNDTCKASNANNPQTTELQPSNWHRGFKSVIGAFACGAIGHFVGRVVSHPYIGAMGGGMLGLAYGYTATTHQMFPIVVWGGLAVCLEVAVDFAMNNLHNVATQKEDITRIALNISKLVGTACGENNSQKRLACLRKQGCCVGMRIYEACISGIRKDLLNGTNYTGCRGLDFLKNIDLYNGKGLTQWFASSWLMKK